MNHYLYVCNRKRCEKCRAECNHTTELKFAKYKNHKKKDFKKIAPNIYKETERKN